MEVTQVLQGTHNTTQIENVQRLERTRQAFAAKTRDQMQQRDERMSREQVKQLTRELQALTQTFNKRLSFRFNDQLEQMVVKVIDRETDTVIKELPPSELQRVHLRIREAIGLLLDESV